MVAAFLCNLHPDPSPNTGRLEPFFPRGKCYSGQHTHSGRGPPPSPSFSFLASLFPHRITGKRYISCQTTALVQSQVLMNNCSHLLTHKAYFWCPDIYRLYSVSFPKWNSGLLILDCHFSNLILSTYLWISFTILAPSSQLQVLSMISH